MRGLLRSLWRMEPRLAPSKQGMNHLVGVTLLLLMLSVTSEQSNAAKLDAAEVGALRKIANALGKKDWDFRADPCRGDGKGNWVLFGQAKGFENNVSCQCPSNASSCHVVSIALKGENFTGTLSPEFAKLRFLKSLDLSRNCLTGGIPKEWATMRLEELSVMGNRLSGPFPSALTSIASLANLSIEGNWFSGTIPPEIGKMKKLEKLVMSSNNFTGVLPVELSKLTKLKDLRISDNSFSGKIPDFIGNLTLLEKLQIMGCNLEGPIPSIIFSLTKLADLRITDLKGRGSTFPKLDNMESIKILVLRKCSIHGEIPAYLGKFEKLKTLDLSFNDITGHIPSTFGDRSKFDYLYLTGNKLNGSLPYWIQSTTHIVDLSYNNLTVDGLTPGECPRASVNLVESFSRSKDKPNNKNACLRSGYPCTLSKKEHRSTLYINCGGKEAIIGGTKYEADLEVKGSSTLYEGNGWAFSSTGNFMDDDTESDRYIERNTSALSSRSGHNAELLYTTARTSALSLTYYGLCLFQGSYNVTLHFAEIKFSNDSTLLSLGKRVFDVYIQDKLVLEDFDIQKEAGGTGIPIIKVFTTNVTSGTLKVHFYWAGRGTTGIPYRGVYGPLISAISVKSNFTPPSFGKFPFPVKLLAVLVTASVVLILLILGLSWRKGWLHGEVAPDKELRGLDLLTGSFTLRQIKAATRNFDSANKVGEGGFGSVYKGTLSDGTVIAVKQLSSKSKQGNREFVNEIGMISGLQHPNLVKLYGCCVEGNNLLLVYEYMVNNCLSRALFGKDEAFRLKLDWPTRQMICLGIARGLAYLHEESRLKIVHRDIKASNVLLDKDLNAKISDFGLAKLNEDDQSHISTRVAGTIGYMAPEYAMRGYLTDKADVYSFGVVTLEIASGKSNTNYRPKDDFVNLLDWAYVLQERGSILDIIDPNLDYNYSREEAMVMVNIALLCTNVSPTLRPTMSQVVSMLEKRTAIQDLLSDLGIAAANAKYRTIRNHFWQNHSPAQNHGEQSLCSRCSCFCSSTEESKRLITGDSRELNNDEDA